MTQRDIIGLVLSYAYASGLLFGMEWLGARMKWKTALTRKIIHIGAGMWAWATLALFDHWYIGVIPFATFIGLNTYFYRAETFGKMNDKDSSPGTIYFAISIAILFGLLWRTGGAVNRAPIAMAGVMAMTWGDAMASIIGRKIGIRRYKTFGHTRTYEGSAAMAAFAFIAVSAALSLTAFVSPGSISIGNPAILALAAAAVATLAEAFSPAGTDNLSVPLLVGLVVGLLNGVI